MYINFISRNPELCIKTENPISISGSTTTDRILVDQSVSATITLAGVNIDLSATGDEYFTGYSPLTCKTDERVPLTLTLAEGTINTLKGGYHATGLEKEHASGLLTTSGGSVRTVVKEGCNPIGGTDSESGAVTPVNNANKKVHPLVMKNAADANVLVDEISYPHKNHKAADTFETTPLSANASSYLYLDEEHHAIQLGETIRCFHWANGQFSSCTVSDTLSHNNFVHWNTCTEPTCTGRHNSQLHVQDIHKSDDTQFWRECVCGYINPNLPKQDKPLFLIAGADRVCQGQDYVFTITLGEGLAFDDMSNGYAFTTLDRRNYFNIVPPKIRANIPSPSPLPNIKAMPA